MKTSKLIEILISLNRNEFNEFGRYVETKFFNKTEDVTLLLSYLKKHYPLFENATKLDKTHVAKQLFKGKITRLERVAKDLSKHLKNYLIWKELQIEDTIQEKLLRRAYLRRQLDHYLFQYQATIEKRIRQSSKRGINYHAQFFDLNATIFHHPGVISFSSESLNAFKAYRSHFDKYYLHIFLQNLCDILIIQTQYKLDIKLPFLQAAKDYLDTLSLEEDPILEMYLIVIQLFEPSDLAFSEREKKYQRLRQLFEKNYNKYSKKEQRTILTFILNCIVYNINHGRDKYTKELFELYIWGIDSEILLDNGHLPIRHFLNIVDTTIALQYTDWIEKKFFPNYRQLLPLKERKNALNLTQALVTFHIDKDFDKTISLLHDKYFITSSDLMLNIYMRCLRIMAAYETKDWIFLNNNCAAFEQYLRRKTERGTSLQKSNYNFIRMTLLLSKAYYKTSKTIAQLSQKLQSYEVIAHKRWLTAKINDFVS